MADAAGTPAATATASTAPGGGVAFGPAANAPRSRRPLALLVAGLIGLALFAAFGLAVFQDVEAPFTQPLDDAWRRLVGASGLDQVSRVVPMAFQYLGEIPGAVLTILLIPAWLS